MNSRGSLKLLTNQPDNGTLIDHIYVRNTISLSTNIQIHTFYSDHDLTVMEVSI